VPRLCRWLRALDLGGTPWVCIVTTGKALDLDTDSTTVLVRDDVDAVLAADGIGNRQYPPPLSREM
jgi:hypothetical protein